MTKNTKYIQSAKVNRTIYHKIYLQSHYTTATKAKTRNHVQSLNNNKSNTKTKYQRYINSNDKVLMK